MKLWILRNRKPEPATSMLQWADHFEGAGHQVARDTIALPGGGTADVSTVFIGIDHHHGMRPHAPPKLFESMVFGGPLDLERYLWETWEQAEAGHKALVANVKAALTR
jgi:hypothetical protein